MSNNVGIDFTELGPPYGTKPGQAAPKGQGVAGSIENQAKIQVQPPYPLNSSILAQSTVRFGSTRIKVAARHGRD